MDRSNASASVWGAPCQKLAIATLVAAFAIGAATPAFAGDADLQSQVRSLTEQVTTLQDQLSKLQALVEQLRASASPPSGTAPAGIGTAPTANVPIGTTPTGAAPAAAAPIRAAAPHAVATGTAATATASDSSAPGAATGVPGTAVVAVEKPPEEQATTIGGYGELNYNNYVKDSSRNQADLRRFVIFLGHRFTDQLSFNSEVEWEHAVVSENDQGETEIEQAYLDYNFRPGLSLKAGLFLMPFGFLNTSHEPPAYYGVERNFVETNIIPTTWREGGLGLYGTTESGLAWDVGVTTSFDMAKFEDPAAPLQSTHQEMELAHARDLAAYAALNYRGVPGLTVGGALFHGNTGQGNADYNENKTLPNFAGISAPLTLWELHARWQASGLDLETLVTQGHIGQAGEMDNVLLNYNTANGTSRPYVPSSFYGWLAQGAYTVWQRGDITVTPFLRYEQFNSQAPMPVGFAFASDPANADRVVTAGLSFKPHPQVVFKADYQRFLVNSINNRFDLGVGYMF